MNTRSITAPRLPALHIAAPASAMLRRVLARLHAMRRRRALEAELSALTDRELADIGMRRAMAPTPTLGLPHALYR